MYAKDDKRESQNIHKSIELKCPLHISTRQNSGFIYAVSCNVLRCMCCTDWGIKSTAGWQFTCQTTDSSAECLCVDNRLIKRAPIGLGSACTEHIFSVFMNLCHTLVNHFKHSVCQGPENCIDLIYDLLPIRQKSSLPHNLQGSLSLSWLKQRGKRKGLDAGQFRCVQDARQCVALNHPTFGALFSK